MSNRTVYFNGIQLGLKPVIVDIDLNSLAIDLYYFGAPLGASEKKKRYFSFSTLFLLRFGGI